MANIDDLTIAENELIELGFFFRRTDNEYK
jgi:hypothetical protein